jgi:hypothetical protein
VVAGLANRIVATSYRRLDDGGTPGFASLSEWSRVLVTEGCFSFLRPPEQEIHRLENPFKQPAATLHVFGPHGDGQHRYDLALKSLTAVASLDLVGV